MNIIHVVWAASIALAATAAAQRLDSTATEPQIMAHFEQVQIVQNPPVVYWQNENSRYAEIRASRKPPQEQGHILKPQDGAKLIPYTPQEQPQKQIEFVDRLISY